MRQAGAAGAYAACTGSLAASKSGSDVVVGPLLPMINLCVRHWHVPTTAQAQLLHAQGAVTA